jgi:hexosaminidase
MTKQLLFSVVLSCAFVLFVNSQNHKANFQIIPLPDKIEYQGESVFKLDKYVEIVYPAGNKEMENNAAFLATYLEETINHPVKINIRAKRKNYIRLVLDNNINHKEGYNIKIDKHGIIVKASTPAGVFYGIQTLRKSLPVQKTETILMPAVEISDYPRFSYRGLMLDVARHFNGVENVKTYIDILALHNVNHLHLHLTDDQGWRIEIKKYPLLTEIGSKRPETVIGKDTGEYDGIPHEGYFTREDIKDLITYAKDRYITIIPEIDLPGHMIAVLAAYPELGCTGCPYEVWKKWGIAEDALCAGNDKVLTFIEDVLTEVAVSMHR